MSNFNTRKSNFQSKVETVSRRAQRAAKYANAATTTRSGRTRNTLAKAAF